MGLKQNKPAMERGEEEEEEVMSVEGVGSSGSMFSFQGINQWGSCSGLSMVESIKKDDEVLQDEEEGSTSVHPRGGVTQSILSKFDPCALTIDVVQKIGMATGKELHMLLKLALLTVESKTTDRTIEYFRNCVITLEDDRVNYVKQAVVYTILTCSKPFRDICCTGMMNGLAYRPIEPSVLDAFVAHGLMPLRNDYVRTVIETQVYVEKIRALFLEEEDRGRGVREYVRCNGLLESQ